MALGSLAWFHWVVWLCGDSHSTGSLHVREPGRQQVLVFPREGVLLALARVSHTGGLVSVCEPRDLLALSCPGSCVSLQEGLAAGTAQRCSLPLVLPSLCAPEFSKAAGSFPASLGSVSQDPGCVWLSLAVGCSQCGMTAQAWVFLAPLHLFIAKVWAGISLPGKRSSFHRVSGRAFPTFRAPLSSLALSV